MSSSPTRSDDGRQHHVTTKQRTIGQNRQRHTCRGSAIQRQRESEGAGLVMAIIVPVMDIERDPPHHSLLSVAAIVEHLIPKEQRLPD